MRRLTMFEGGILSSVDHEQVARTAAINAMASRLAAAGLTGRVRQNAVAEPPGNTLHIPPPAPIANNADEAHATEAQAGDAPDATTAFSMRQTTVVFLITAMAAGLLLYREKSRAAMLDHEIGRVIRATEEARRQTGLLRAEWASLNEPERLRGMADRYLSLHATEPSQFVELSKLSHRLSTLPPAPLQPIAEPPPAEISSLAEDAADGQPDAQQPAIYKASAEIKIPSPEPRIPETKVADPKIVARTSAAEPPASASHLHAVRAVLHAPPAERAEPKPPEMKQPELKQAELKPHVMAHHVAVEKVAEKIELPKWLTQAHVSHLPPLVMSERPHLLGVPHSAPLPLAAPKSSAATALRPPSPDAAPEPRRPEIVADSKGVPPAPPYSPPVYRQPYGYYGYGYGYGAPYRVPYSPPYGGYYGGQYPAYR
jgi:hypothetical protein